MVSMVSRVVSRCPWLPSWGPWLPKFVPCYLKWSLVTVVMLLGTELGPWVLGIPCYIEEVPGYLSLVLGYLGVVL